MACCDRCADTGAWTFEVNGDGDGIEFLDEIALLRNGTYRVTTVVFSRTT